jgi:tRNA-2-methylthio-N6-dimethylallyladenosine synthase
VTRRFYLRTFGCQMNVHDSEKVANLLLHAGWAGAEDPEQAELLLIHTCSIREKAEQRLYTDLGALRRWKEAAPGRLLGVGGCVAQQEGDAVLRRFPHLDFAFGTHNLRLVPALAESAAAGVRQARTEETTSPARFDLPERHPHFSSATPGRAFLTVMEGCDMFCTFCVVPRTRGREVSRPADAIEAEGRSLAARGVRELTMLGQTVNAYGRHDLRRAGCAETGVVAFPELLRRLAAIPGVVRLRYTSPHPIFVDEALIRAHADLPALCPHVHLPVQSGSDRVLARMRRRHTAADYLRRVEALRYARPDLVLTTDLIVGFPGESEADFEATLALVRAAAFVDAYAFKYSPRPGTRAAGFSDAVAPELAQDRLERLQALQRAQTLAYHRSRVGELTEILVEGASRRGAGQVQGRDPQHRVVNVSAGPGVPALAPGSLLRVRLVEATPHSLIGEPAEGPGGIREDSPVRVKEASRRADEARRAPAAA